MDACVSCGGGVTMTATTKMTTIKLMGQKQQVGAITDSKCLLSALAYCTTSACITH